MYQCSKRDLSHMGGIFESSVGSEQTLMGEEQFSCTFCWSLTKVYVGESRECLEREWAKRQDSL